MAHLDQSHKATRDVSHTPDRDDGARHLTIADAILLAALAVGGFALSEHLGSAPQSTKMQQPAVKQTVCSDEELRHMRSGIETCYDEPSPHPKKSEFTAPATINNT